MGDNVVVVIMTVNKASVICVERELVAVLWVQLKAVYSSSWCHLVLIREKSRNRGRN